MSKQWKSALLRRQVCYFAMHLLTIGLPAFLVSCASIDATTTEYVGASHHNANNPSNVEILRSAPTRPHESIGEVVIDASTEPAPPIAEVEEKLRAEAAKIGADAVVVVLDRVQPTAMYVTGGYWNRSVQTLQGRKLVGVAIKYRS